jgi:NifB/MoaA-like Fe-S oxidoreductase
LPRLRTVTPELAIEYLDAAETWGSRFVNKLGERFIYAADELFLLSGRLPPQVPYYDSFPQIENGIGMVRAFLDRWEQGKLHLRDLAIRDAGRGTPVRMALVTGTLAARFLAPVVEELRDLAVPKATLVPIENDFFGHGITVSGLLAGRDIIASLKNSPWDLAILPPNCINGDGLTIDDMTVADLQAATGIPVSIGEYDLARGIGNSLGDGNFSAVRSRGDGRQLSEFGFFVGSGQRGEDSGR